jgi:hypothetical protein
MALHVAVVRPGARASTFAGWVGLGRHRRVDDLGPGGVRHVRRDHQAGQPRLAVLHGQQAPRFHLSVGQRLRCQRIQQTPHIRGVSAGADDHGHQRRIRLCHRCSVLPTFQWGPARVLRGPAGIPHKDQARDDGRAWLRQPPSNAAPCTPSGMAAWRPLSPSVRMNGALPDTPLNSALGTRVHRPAGPEPRVPGGEEGDANIRDRALATFSIRSHCGLARAGFASEPQLRTASWTLAVGGATGSASAPAARRE